MTEFLTAPRPLRTVLIANRGEIACRIIDTCRRLGLRTLAVYSEADAGARHVRRADDALCIGPAPPAQSYLNQDVLLKAARNGGADAVHPGYGFLSENAAFVRACEAAGLVFVGPSAEAVAAMGSKVEARRIAEAAGVPVVPGFSSGALDDAALAEAAGHIGYPVLVKASAGGGGRGMRRVDAPAALADALASARAEARSAFGDDQVFLEKLITAPRHLEVQVFGDGTGGVLHLHERDCSVQRNHQKVIEEAPAPNLPEAVRQTLFDHALTLASAIRYAGAGTVEFIMQAGDDQPYFLEMNTRLQVEHPVTEAICGVDLVEWQLRQAAGLPLPLTQAQIRPRGHAIEVRVNAERPEAGFLPDTGTVEAVAVPPGLRFDTGIEAGSRVGSDYDSMVAKVIAHGADRDAARRKLRDGLRHTVVAGLGTNLGFLADCLAAPAFAEGRATTLFLEQTFPDGWRPDPDALLHLRGQAVMAALEAAADGSPLTRTDGFRLAPRARPGAAHLRVVDGYGEAELTLVFGQPWTIRHEGRSLPLRGPATLHHAEGCRVRVADGGLCLEAEVRPRAEVAVQGPNGGDTEGRVLAPLAGLVTDVMVAAGDVVTAGDTLVVMEAMKLVHALKAPFDGHVRAVNCRAGETLGAKSVLIELEEAS